MTDNPRLRQLLDELLDSHATPEEVCASCPELLPPGANLGQQLGAGGAHFFRRGVRVEQLVEQLPQARVVGHRQSSWVRSQESGIGSQKSGGRGVF